MKKRNLILAVDFDGTTVEHNYPAIGAPLPDAFDVLKSFVEKGDKLILWTCREGMFLTEAIRFCKENGVEFEAHNDNLLNVNNVNTRKIFADMYIDDRMPGGFPGWLFVQKQVEILRKTI